ncbi:MAG: hypothetical protein RLN96_06960 [Pseudomonadales bacterium]
MKLFQHQNALESEAVVTQSQPAREAQLPIQVTGYRQLVTGN